MLQLRKTHIVEALALMVGALLLGVLFWSFQATDPMWAIISFILVYDPESRMVFATALARLFMTILGSLLAMGAVWAFGVHKATLPLSVGIIALVCGLLQRSRMEQRIVLVTVALIIGSSILQASMGPYIAMTRSIEVTVGSLLAVVFSWTVSHILSGKPGKSLKNP